MIYLLIALAFMLIFCIGYLRRVTVNIPGAAELLNQRWTIIIDCLGYAASLWAISKLWPDFWKAWHNPPGVYWSTNTIMVIGLIAATTTIPLRGRAGGPPTTLRRGWGWFAVGFFGAATFLYCVITMVDGEITKRKLAKKIEQAKQDSIALVQKRGQGQIKDQENEQMAVGQFPFEGRGYVSDTIKLKATFDPSRTYIRKKGKAVYLFLTTGKMYYDTLNRVMDATESEEYSHLSVDSCLISGFEKGKKFYIEWALDPRKLTLR